MKRIRATTIEQVINMNDTMDGQGRILIFFARRVDESRMRRAVDLTIEAQPLLGYRFVDDPIRPYWLYVDPADRSPPFSIVEADAAGTSLHDFMVEPVPPEQAPQIRVRLFRSREDMICIRTNHIAIDGGGAIQYLALLAMAYRELARDPSYRPKVADRRRCGPRQVLRRAGLVNSLRSMPSLRSPSSKWGIGAERNDLTRQDFIIRAIAADRLGAIKAYAKKRQVTINDVLLTAFCRALFDLCDPPYGMPLRIEVPTNLRRYLPEGEMDVTSNLAAVYFIGVERKEGELFEDTLERVHARVDRQKKDQVELGEMLLLELLMLPGKSFLMKMQKAVDFEIAHPVLSNLGVIERKMVDFGEVGVKDVQMIGPTLYPPNVGLGVCTFGDTMTLNINYCVSAIAREKMMALMDKVLQELPE